jgi:hypothetical protein
VERRKARRRPILNTFSLFVVAPKKGFHRLVIHDVSDLGIGFDLDTEGEDPGMFPIQPGDQVDLRLYLNQSLFLPVTVEVVRVQDQNTVRRVGAEFGDKNSKGYKAFLSFIQMLDGIVDAVRIDETGALG